MNIEIISISCGISIGLWFAAVYIKKTIYKINYQLKCQTKQLLLLEKIALQLGCQNTDLIKVKNTKTGEIKSYNINDFACKQMEYETLENVLNYSTKNDEKFIIVKDEKI